jgi:ankyrin repeat protein
MRCLVLAAVAVLLALPAQAQIGIEVLIRRPLAEAAREGNVESVRQQLATGVTANQLDLDNRPALALAAINGNAEIAKLLLDARAMPDLRDREGRTALMWASERGHAGVVQTLIAGRANLNLIERSTSATALMLAAREGHLRVVEALVQAKADLTPTDATGRTALAIAETSNRRAVADYLRRNGAPR